MDWLARKMYPKARPYERRSRMQMFYLMVSLVMLVVLVLAGVLWLMNKPMQR